MFYYGALCRKRKNHRRKGNEKTEVAATTKKAPASSKPREKKTAMAPAAPLDLWRAFDDVFERFRSDFEDLLFPSYWDRELSLFPETRIPAVDLEDREKDYILKAEMPGFKKEDIEIEVKEDSVEITGKVGWKYAGNTIRKSKRTFARSEPANRSTGWLSCQRK
jgi:HSP20 family molecular chaperone IbpA